MIFSLNPYRKRVFRCVYRRPLLSLVYVLISSSLLEISLPAQVPPPTATISPSDLLPALPPVPEDWKLLKSIGSNKFSVLLQPQTIVTRNYQVPPPPPDPHLPPPAVPPPPGFLAMDVLDMGSQGNGAKTLIPPKAQSNGDPNAEPEGMLKLPLFEGHLNENPDHSQFFYGPLGTRLLIQVSCRDITPKDFKKILKAFDFSPLAALDKKLPTTPLKGSDYTNTIGTRVFKYKTFTTENVYIDELNPQLNRTWKGAAVQQQP